MKTKGDIVRLALRRAGLASSATLTQPDPAAVGDALNDLDLMMAQWVAGGIDIGYLSGEPEDYENDPDPYAKLWTVLPDDESGLELWAIEPVALKLAEKILIDNLRPVPDALAAQAKAGYELVCSKVIVIPALARRDDMPVGAGNKPLRDARFYWEGESDA